MVSWQVPYLAKGCKPDINNGLRGDSNSGPILAPWRLFKSDSNNGRFPGHLNLVLDGATSVHVSYLWFPGRCHLAKGYRPDFNNGLRGDWNSDPILAPRRLFESDSNNGPSPGHLNLLSDGVTSVHVSYLWFPSRCNTGQGLQALLQ